MLSRDRGLQRSRPTCSTRRHHHEGIGKTEGAVNLSGTFHHPGDVLALKHQVAEIEGVIRLEIMAQFVT